MYKHAVVAGLSAVLALPSALAYTDYSEYPSDSDYYRDRDDYVASREYDGYAKVTRVEPVRVRRDVSEPREECREVPVNTQRRDVEGPGTTARTVIGALIGAGIGYGVGRDHRDGEYATAAGGLAGAALGAKSAERNTRVVNRTHYETRCRTVYDRRTEERIDGYDVTYRYDGQTYTTRMPYDPGERVPVRVSVTPR